MFDAVRVLLGNVHARQAFLGLVVQRRADECDEQRVWPGGPALEFGVRLRADDERMDVGGVFDELDKVPVGRGAGELQPALGDALDSIEKATVSDPKTR